MALIDGGLVGMLADSIMTPSAGVHRFGAVVQTADSAFTADPSVVTRAYCGMNGESIFTSLAKRSKNGAASIVADSVFTSSGMYLMTWIVAGNTNFASAANASRSGVVNLSSDSVMTTAATVLKAGAAVMSSDAIAVITGQRLATGSVVMVSDSIFDADALEDGEGAVDMNGQATLLAQATVSYSVQIAFVGSSVVIAVPRQSPALEDDPTTIYSAPKLPDNPFKPQKVMPAKEPSGFIDTRRKKRVEEV